MIARRTSILLALGALVLAGGHALALTGPELAAGDAKSVPTQTITIPPGSGDSEPPVKAGGDEAAPAPDAAASQAAEPAPVVEYDVSKLPTPVRRLREQLLEAAKSGDINRLKPILDANPEPPTLSLDETQTGDPIAYLKSISGDPDGREILAILSEILEAGYVHIDVGTPQELYVWPYFARYPIDKLTPPQMVELFRLLTASDFDEMKTFGAYVFYRLGIKPDGSLDSFVAGD